MTEYRKTVPPAMKMYQLSRFSFGKATSFAPIIKGIRKLPSTAGIEGARKKKIITRPCRVNILLYVDGSMREPCGSIRFKRIRVAAAPPTKKKKVIAARYSQAILL